MDNVSVDKECGVGHCELANAMGECPIQCHNDEVDPNHTILPSFVLNPGSCRVHPLHTFPSSPQVHVVYESILDWDSFSVRVREFAVEDVPQVLEAISDEQVREGGGSSV